MSARPFPTHAVVLAGGFGTRLRSVVSEVPKPMAPIHGRPFLGYLLAALAERGVTAVTLAVGYKGELIEARLGDRLHGLALTYSYEREPLGTGGAVALALADRPRDSPVWVLNGDTYFDCDLAAVARTHHAAAADVTLALKYVDPADRYGLVETWGERIVRFREKRPGAGGLINAGVYLLQPAALGRFDLPRRFSLERDLFEAHLDGLRLAGATQDGYFVDIGVPEDYARAQAYFGAARGARPRG